jgi:hypothetical protein
MEVLVEKLTVAHLVKKLTAFYVNRGFSAVFEEPCHYPEPVESSQVTRPSREAKQSPPSIYEVNDAWIFYHHASYSPSR